VSHDTYSTPSVQDIYARNGGTGLSDSLDAELDEDQRAFLNCVLAEEAEPTDEQIEADHRAKLLEREMETIAAEFLMAYESYIEAVVEADTALVEQRRFEQVAKALEVA
jgi:hypothetical protein